MCIQEYFQLVLCWEVCPPLGCPLSEVSLYSRNFSIGLRFRIQEFFTIVSLPFSLLRFLSACSEERAAKSYSSSSSLREGSPGSVSSVTVTGDEEQGTLLPAARTESLPQINVITPLYSHTSSSVTSETSGRREAQETGLTGLGSVEREESEPQQRAAGMQYDYQLYPLNPTSSRTSVTTDVRSNTTTTSEVDFRNNLASLDADIARLQMQFKVALQPSNDSTQ